MKIIVWVYRLGGGGAERVMVTFMNNLNRGRFKPEVLSLRSDGPLLAQIEKDETGQ